MNEMTLAAHIEASDAAQLAWEEAQYAEWESAHSEYLVEQAYQTWADIRRCDGEDDSREAWEQSIEDSLPED